MDKLRVGIAGATGYLGTELVKILAQHPRVDLAVLASSSKAGQSLASELPQFRGVLPHTLTQLDAEDPDATFTDADVVFLAMPHGKAHEMVPKLVAGDPGRVIIDLSGDHRIRNVEAATAAYGFAGGVPAVFGIPEIHRAAIKRAHVIANPGCYPTASILAGAPLLANGCAHPSIIVDAKSGITGAGREPSTTHHFPEGNERVQAYKVGEHRHEPEIAQGLTDASGHPTRVTFSPHLVPMNRGLLATVYLDAVGPVLSQQEAQAIFEKKYANEPWVRVIDDQPDTKLVRGTNFADIHVKALPRHGRYIVTCAIDNLIKGGSGQAVQNMNIRFGLPETEGLPRVGGGV